MPRFQHEIELSPLPRPWLEHAVRVLYDVAEELRFDDEGRLTIGGESVDAVRLTEGGHLAEGARYELSSDLEEWQIAVQVEVLAWKPSGVSRLKVDVQVDQITARATIELHREKDRLRTIRCTGRVGIRGKWARFLQLSWDAEADLHRWWEHAASRRKARREERAAPP
ncbi:hypothetical protein ACFQ07_29650, partial [Actinomadura adrarensis]